MKWFWTSKAEPDLSRRGFIFGAAATIILPPPKTFHLMPKTFELPDLRERGLILPTGKMFDLPNIESLRLAQKLLDGQYKISDVPRWVVVDKQWYDDVVRNEPPEGYVVCNGQEIGHGSAHAGLRQHWLGGEAHAAGLADPPRVMGRRAAGELLRRQRAGDDG